MSGSKKSCPDCAGLPRVPEAVWQPTASRRQFLRTAGALSAAGLVLERPWLAWAEPTDAASTSSPESLVKVLYDSLSSEQRQAMCYAWDYVHPEMGLLRTRVANNWHVNDKIINSDFYSSEQRDLIRKIFEGIIQPDWHARIDKQLEDDAGGFGEDQNVAIFGTPGEGKFEFLMTGRHMTLRCDGNSAEHVALGGPIFYGHAADGFNEGPQHPGNVFWPQAVAANQVFAMLDERQQKLALVKKLPREEAVAFRAEGRPGIAVSELSSDQQGAMEEVLGKLIEPYRQTDRDEVRTCLAAQGGLAACSLAFYQDGDIGNDRTWDCWRLEGPAMVWYFRGTPHVHVWVNVADDPSVALNA